MSFIPLNAKGRGQGTKIPLINKKLNLKFYDDFLGRGQGQKILKSQKFHLQIKTCI
jgi:hypothetical protein